MRQLKTDVGRIHGTLGVLTVGMHDIQLMLGTLIAREAGGDTGGSGGGD